MRKNQIVYNKKTKIRAICKSYGQDFNYEKGGWGDNPTASAEQMRNFARNILRVLEGVKCPKYKEKIWRQWNEIFH